MAATEQSRTPTGTSRGAHKSANGSRANRADEQNHGRASGADEITPPRARLPFTSSALVASAPPVKASLRLRLLPRVAALGLDGARLRCRGFQDEGMAGFRSFRKRPTGNDSNSIQEFPHIIARDFRKRFQINRLPRCECWGLELW